MTTDTPVWFVKAPSSGSGERTAVDAMKRGHKVMATARNSSRLADLKAFGAVKLDLDVTEPLEELKTIVAEAHKQSGRIDTLANAAGYVVGGGLEEINPKEAFDCFNTNVFGGPGCHPSRLAIRMPGGGTYFNTKCAVTGMCMQVEMAPLSIDVCCIEPGFFGSATSMPAYCSNTSKIYQITGMALQERRE